MKFSLKAVRKIKKAIQKEDMQMKKRAISILLSAAMISSMVVAGGVTAHAEENVTLNVFDAHAYGLDEIIAANNRIEIALFFICKIGRASCRERV